MRPFSALRYDPAVAGPLDDLVSAGFTAEEAAAIIARVTQKQT